jgi:hypothetical protein
MPELGFRLEGTEPVRFAATPLLAFKLRVTADEAGEAADVHAILLRCQIRIEPGRRCYEPDEQERLLAVFGTPERWGQTVRDMLWTHVVASIGAFTGETVVELSVPCSCDFSLAATTYFDALGGGEIPLKFLFSGTVFHAGPRGLQVMPISWEQEASFRLPASAWHELMGHYYPNATWLPLRKDVFNRLHRYKSRAGLPTWEETVERLLATGEESPT